MALDPVCGMTVDPATAKHSHEHAGTMYFFCSSGCRTKFMAELDTSGLGQGIYIVKVVTREGITVRKVVKE